MFNKTSIHVATDTRSSSSGCRVRGKLKREGDKGRGRAAEQHALCLAPSNLVLVQQTQEAAGTAAGWGISWCGQASSPQVRPRNLLISGMPLVKVAVHFVFQLPAYGSDMGNPVVQD